MSKYNCPLCTFENSSLNDNCQMCGTPNPKPTKKKLPNLPPKIVRSSSSKESSLACSVCTFVNSADALRCAICNQETALGQANKARQSMVAETGWTCPICTFHNEDEQSITCSVCGSQNSVRKQQLEEQKRREEEEKRRQKEEEERKKEEERKDMIEKGEAKLQNNINLLENALKWNTKKSSISVSSSTTTSTTTSTSPSSESVPGNAPEIVVMIKELYEDAHKCTNTEGKKDSPKKKMNGPPSTMCLVCYCDFEPDSPAVKVSGCGHTTACQTCFTEYLKHRIKDKDILPYIPCPAENCHVALQPKNLYGNGVSDDVLRTLMVTHLVKLLARENNWVECTQKNCSFGFLLPPQAEKDKQEDSDAFMKAVAQQWEKNQGKGILRKGNLGKVSVQSKKIQKKKCNVCGTSQIVKRKTQVLDPSFKKMLEEGKIRPCPKCKHLTMKEYGICNVIQCAKCSIWWNWKSRETGTSSRQLKQRARMNGSLWMPGELNFQRDLQQKDPQKFKDLLERNGMKYNPNYVRGT